MFALPSFNDVIFSAVERDGEPWITSSDLARALDYSQPNQVTRIYSRNADEFSVAMTAIERVATREGQSDPLGANLVSEVRIFSLRGAHLVAMFARTPIAKAFRRWLLDLIEAYAAAPRVVEPFEEQDGDILPGVDISRMAVALTAINLARRLFGEAVARRHWVAYGMPGAGILAAEDDADELASAVRLVIEDRETVTVVDIAAAIGIRGAIGMGLRRRIDDVLRALGWENVNVKRDRKVSRVWRRATLAA